MNVAIVAGLLAQAAAGIWYAGKVDATISDYGRRIAHLEAQRIAADREAAAMREALASQLAELRADLESVGRAVVARERGAA